MSHNQQNPWIELGRAPAGGAVLDLETSANHELWAASLAGLFHRHDGQWRAIATLPETQVGSVFASGRLVIAAGLAGGAYYSVDRGERWYACYMEQVQSPVSCISASKNFHKDATLLAGTLGDGILRSRDGGRIWELANFGLRSFTVYCLAAAAVWGRREPVFAGAELGVYYSPNGGRAWLPRGLEESTVLALAISPNFASDQTVLAGLAEGGLRRSCDGGLSWQVVDIGLDDSTTINALAWQAGMIFAATDGAGVLRSNDGGQTWHILKDGPPGALCLECGTQPGPDGSIDLLAGLPEDGLWVTHDLGEHWTQDEYLTARRYHWLAEIQSPTGAPGWFAVGAEDGAWRVDQETGWRQVENMQDDRILSMAASQGRIWAGTEAGVWSLDSSQMVWERRLEAGEAITALAAGYGRVLAGSGSGRIWIAEGLTNELHEIASPLKGGMLAAAGLAEGTAFVAGWDARGRELQLWYANLQTLDWSLSLSERVSPQAVLLAQGPHGWAIALGSRVIRQASPGGWQHSELGGSGHPLTALVWWESEQLWLAAAGSQVFSSQNLQDWMAYGKLPEGAAIAAILPEAQGKTIWALTRQGRLWSTRV